MCPDQRGAVGLMRSLGVTAPYLAKLSHLARPLLTTYCWPACHRQSGEGEEQSTTLVETIGPTKSVQQQVLTGVAGLSLRAKDWD